jgi:hypothetical protein
MTILSDIASKQDFRQHVCTTLHAKLLGTFIFCRSQWPRNLRRGSSAARLLWLPVRIPPGVWMSVTCECCVLPSRGLRIGPTARSEEFYRVWCILVWYQTSMMRRSRHTRAVESRKGNTVTFCIHTKIHISSFSDPLLTSVKLKAK